MYNLRYHIASLVSVFIALALGLVLGGLIVDEGSPVDNQAIVDGLKADIELVREQNAEARAHNDLLSSFIDGNVDLLIADQLEGFAVIVVRDDGEVADVAQSVVTRAGATALPFSLDQAKYEALTPQSATSVLLAEHAKKATATTGADTPEGTAQNGDAQNGVTSNGAAAATDDTANKNGEFSAIDSLAAALAAEWTAPTLKSRPFTDALISDGVLTAYGVDWANTTILGIVDATAQTDPIEHSLTFAILKSLADASYPAIVTTTDEQNQLDIEAEVDASDISTLNTLGTSIGDYTLIALLKGATPGRYGMMENAIASYVLMPAQLLHGGAVFVPEPKKDAEQNAEEQTATP